VGLKAALKKYWHAGFVPLTITNPAGAKSNLFLKAPEFRGFFVFARFISLRPYISAWMKKQVLPSCVCTLALLETHKRTDLSKHSRAT
jgi:hypothetical protein